MYLPIQSMQHKHPEVKYVLESTLIFQEWRQTGKPGLTTETFTACIQSMTAIPELAKHLLERHGIHYVLTGKLMSDPLEGRFGWYRQTNGDYLFVYVKQLLPSEKKIRCLSLLRQDVLLTTIQH